MMKCSTFKKDLKKEENKVKDVGNLLRLRKKNRWHHNKRCRKSFRLKKEIDGTTFEDMKKNKKIKKAIKNI